MKIMILAIIALLLLGCGNGGVKMEQFIYLVEIDAYDPASASVKTLRFCSGQPYISGPTESPANTAYLPRVIQAGRMRRDCWKAGTTGGETDVSYGVTELNNADGSLDYMDAYSYDGRNFVVKVGRSTAPLAAFEVVYAVTMNRHPQFSNTRITINPRGWEEQFARPVTTRTYAGNNTLPDGIEGDANLTGKNKPYTIGAIYMMEPVLVNTSRLIYQYDDPAAHWSGRTGPPLAAIVMDKGVPLSIGSGYVSQSDMESNAPAPGEVRIWSPGGMFRLGSSPAGKITIQTSPGWAVTMNDLVTDLVRGPGNVASLLDLPVEFSASSISYLGITAGQQDTIASMLDEITASHLCWWGFDRLGQFKVRQLVNPSLYPAAVTFTEDQIISIEKTDSDDVQIPVWKIAVNYRENYAPLGDSDCAGSVAVVDRRDFATEWRTVERSDPSVLAAHLLSPVMTLNGLHFRPDGAYAEANAALNLYKVKRDRLKVRVALTPENVALLDLGTIVKIVYPRWAYSTGKCMLVTSIEPDPATGRIDLDLWG